MLIEINIVIMICMFRRVTPFHCLVANFILLPHVGLNNSLLYHISLNEDLKL